MPATETPEGNDTFPWEVKSAKDALAPQTDEELGQSNAETRQYMRGYYHAVNNVIDYLRAGMTLDQLTTFFDEELYAWRYGKSFRETPNDFPPTPSSMDGAKLK